MLVGCVSRSIRHAREQGTLLPRETRVREAGDVEMQERHALLTFQSERENPRNDVEPFAY
jgi:hypothetical protein